MFLNALSKTPMKTDTYYPSYEEVLDVYAKVIERSGGGLHGVRDAGGIKSVLSFIQEDAYYPDFQSKLVHLVYAFCRGHFFSDGNKRIALTIGASFLLKNGYTWVALSFMKLMEAHIYHVAAGYISKELLARIVEKYVNGQVLDEEIQVALMAAMSQGLPGGEESIYND